MELKGKGKVARDPPGPFSVIVLFSDGSNLTVRKNVDGNSASEQFNYHTTGIGAMVGTTKQVRIIDDEGNEITSWSYATGIMPVD